MINPLETSESKLKAHISTLRALIFDFDGTLIDSEPVWKQVFYDLFQERHSVELTDELLWKNTGIGVDKSVANLDFAYELVMGEDDQARMVNDINEETHRRILEDLPLQEGVLELFNLAREHGLSTAICTASTNELITTFLTNHDLGRYIDVVVSTSSSPREQRKPYPYPYLETLKKLSIVATQAIVVEDSPSGVTSSLAAGIATIAIPHPKLIERVAALEPTALVQDFRQIHHLVSRVLR